MSILLYFKSMVCFVLGCFVLGRRGSVLLCLCLLKPLLIFLAAVFPQAVARLPREGFSTLGGWAACAAPGLDGFCASRRLQCAPEAVT